MLLSSMQRQLQGVLAAVLVSVLLITTSAQQQQVFSQGFEAGAFITSPARSSETGIITSCSSASKSVSSAAPLYGAYSAVLNVKTKCQVCWDALTYHCTCSRGCTTSMHLHTSACASSCIHGSTPQHDQPTTRTARRALVIAAARQLGGHSP